MANRFITHSWKLRRSAKLLSEFVTDQAKSLSRSNAQPNSRREQSDFLSRESLDKKSNVVIFLIPDGERVTGGRLQIFTLYRLSREIFRDSDTSVLMCWFPGYGQKQSRVTGHKNDVVVCPFWQVIHQLRPACNLILHFPEYAAAHLCDDLIGLNWLKRNAENRQIHVNILNQNIDSMVNRRFIWRLQNVGCKVTITAAPSHWASPHEQERMGVPIHWLPTWYYEDAAEWQPYESKKNLLIVSPDRSPHRERVLDAIRSGMPDLEIRTIQSMPFEEYTELEKDAKWSITFGEGCDGYFYGPAMRGGVGFAVSNETFAGWALDEWSTLYQSYEQMAEHIVADMRVLDQKSEYEHYSKRLRDRFTRYRSFDALQRQLAGFYKNEYALHPVHSDDIACSAGYH